MSFRGISTGFTTYNKYRSIALQVLHRPLSVGHFGPHHTCMCIGRMSSCVRLFDELRIGTAAAHGSTPKRGSRTLVYFSFAHSHKHRYEPLYLKSASFLVLAFLSCAAHRFPVTLAPPCTPSPDSTLLAVTITRAYMKII